MNTNMAEIVSQNIKAQEIVSRIKILPQKKQFELMQREIETAVEGLIRGMPVLFLAVDDTPAGDAHAVSALYSPDRGTFAVEIPDEPGDITGKDGQKYNRSGGRFPTVLHTIEMFVVAAKLAGGSQYPELEFIRKNDSHPFYERLDDSDRCPFGIAIIPLTYQPQTSNALFFNKNTRKINPQAVANAHYDAMQSDTNLSATLLRHTMLLEGTIEGGNNVLGIGVMDGADTKKYKLFRTARIQPWDDITHPPKFLGETTLPNGMAIRRYLFKHQDWKE